MSSDTTVAFTVDDTFNDTNADVILRSSDNLNFRMYKSLLSFASPFFEGMFTLPQPQQGGGSAAASGDEFHDGLAIIRLPEEGHVVRNLLLFCHPAHAPQLGSLEEIHATLGPAIKYDMAGAIKRLGYMLKQFAPTAPLRVFCIAWQHHLSAESKFAAKHTLSQPMFPRAYVRELELITAGALHRLEEYHHRCGKAAAALAKTYAWIQHDALVQFGGSCWKCSQGQSVPVAGGQIPARSWWTEYMQDAGHALTVKPRGATVKSPELVSKALRKANECAQCRDRVFVEMTEFCDMFAEEVEKVIEMVPLEVEFD